MRSFIVVLVFVFLACLVAIGLQRISEAPVTIRKSVLMMREGEVGYISETVYYDLERIPDIIVYENPPERSEERWKLVKKIEGKLVRAQ